MGQICKTCIMGFEILPHRMPNEYCPHRGVNGGRGRLGSDLKVDDFILKPISKPTDAFIQVPSGFKCRIYLNSNVEIWKGMTDQRAEVSREGRKGIFIAL